MAHPIDDTPVATALAQAVRKAGSDLASEPRRVQAMVSDSLGRDAKALRAQIDAVVLAAEEEIPLALLQGRVGEDDLVIRLRDRGLDQPAATYSIEVWKYALQLLVSHANPPSLTTTNQVDDSTPPPEVAVPTDLSAPPAPERARRRARVMVAIFGFIVVAAVVSALVLADDSTRRVERSAEIASTTAEPASTTAVAPATTVAPALPLGVVPLPNVNGRWTVSEHTQSKCVGILEHCSPSDASFNDDAFFNVVYEVACETTCTITVIPDDGTAPTPFELVRDPNNPRFYVASGSLPAGAKSWRCDADEGTPTRMILSFSASNSDGAGSTTLATELSGLVSFHSERGCPAGEVEFQIVAARA